MKLKIKTLSGRTWVVKRAIRYTTVSLDKSMFGKWKNSQLDFLLGTFEDQLRHFRTTL